MRATLGRPLFYIMSVYVLRQNLKPIDSTI